MFEGFTRTEIETSGAKLLRRSEAPRPQRIKNLGTKILPPLISKNIQSKQLTK